MRTKLHIRCYVKYLCIVVTDTFFQTLKHLCIFNEIKTSFYMIKYFSLI